jgi:hypothetical protein
VAAEYFSNRGRSTLASGISAGATSLTIVALTAGRNFPTSVPFRVVCGTEIIIVGARAGNTFSALTRGAEGTTAASHLAGAVIAHEVTAGILNLLRDIEAHIIPGSEWHVAARLDAILDEIYSGLNLLATTTTYPVTSDGDDVTSDGVPVFTRM